MISFTIVVPVYNAQFTLPRLCRSIERQTVPPSEVIFIDDCSTDKSRSLMEDAIPSHSSWRLLHNKKNSGVSACRNLGIQNAHGKYLMFIDADDWIEPELLRRTADAIRQYQPDVLVFGIAEDFLDKNGSVNYSASHAPKDRVADREHPKELADMIYELEKETLYGYPWNKIYRTELIQKKNLTFPDLSFGEDFFFNRSVFDQARRVAAIPDILYHYVNVDQDHRLTEKYVPDYFELQKRRFQEFLDQQYQLRRENFDLSMIAGRYFRSFASMTARELDHGRSSEEVLSRIQEEMRESSLYEMLCGQLDCSSFITRFLYQPFSEGKAKKALRHMQLFRWGKKHFKGLYHRLKQIR